MPSADHDNTQLMDQIARCDLCRHRFAKTETGHVPKPVVWLGATAPILIAGQAPGARVHGSGIPFQDPSGDRLRAWMGIDSKTFYDRRKISILPMAFCFPGYRKGADLPPPAICAKTWRAQALAFHTKTRLTLLVGGHAQRWHLKTKEPVNTVVGNWQNAPPGILPLPHPSWRNTGWLKRNPWFERDVIVWLRQQVRDILEAR